MHVSPSFLSIMSSYATVLILILLLEVLHSTGSVAAADQSNAASIECFLRDNPSVSAKIPGTQINDNYCDCEDGSDEPQTAACPGTFFRCENKGHKAIKIHSSWLSDSYCDCCDGSDEPPGNCPNTCADLRRDALANIEKQAKVIKDGLTNRASYASRAEEMMSEDVQKLTSLRQEQDSIEKALERADARVKDLYAVRDRRKAAESAVTSRPSVSQNTDPSPEKPDVSNNNEGHDRPGDGPEDDFDDDDIEDDENEERYYASRDDESGDNTIDKSMEPGGCAVGDEKCSVAASSSNKVGQDGNEFEVSDKSTETSTETSDSSVPGSTVDNGPKDDGYRDKRGEGEPETANADSRLGDHDDDIVLEEDENLDEELMGHKDLIKEEYEGVEEDQEEDDEDFNDAQDKGELDDADADDGDDKEEDEVDEDDEDYDDEDFDDDEDYDYEMDRGLDDDDDDLTDGPSEGGGSEVGRSGDDVSGEVGGGTSPKPINVNIDAVCTELENGNSGLVARSSRLLRNILFRLRLKSLFSSADDGLSSVDIDSCVRQAEDVQRKLRSRKSDIANEIRKIENIQGLDYGPDNALRPLHGKCIKQKVLQYEFEHCMFDHVRQYEHGSPIANLGKFRKLTVEDDVTILHYDAGDRCWNGPVRSIKVELQCGDKEEVVSVDEPNRCSYLMKFRTSAACRQDMIDALYAELDTNETSKDEL